MNCSSRNTAPRLTARLLRVLPLATAAAWLPACDLTSVPVPGNNQLDLLPSIDPVGTGDSQFLDPSQYDDPADDQVLSSTPKMPLTSLKGRPTGLIAVGVPPSTIELTWKDNSSDETGFIIQRQIGRLPWEDFTAVGPDVTSYADTTVEAGAQYCYRIVAFHATDSSTPSATVCHKLPVTEPEDDASQPVGAAPSGTPSGVTLSGASEGPVLVKWTDNSSNEDGFLIQRYTAQTKWVDLGTVPADQTKVADGNVQPGTSYCYRVAAFNAAGKTSYSPMKCITAPKPTTPSTGGGTGGTVDPPPPAIPLVRPIPVPWLELNVDEATTVEYAIKGLINWTAVTDTAIVSSEPRLTGQYLLLKQRVPGMRIIPGLKTSPVLGTSDFASVAGWNRIGQVVRDMLAVTEDDTIIFEHETAMKSYLDGAYEIDMDQMREALRQLPQDVHYLWYPSVASSGDMLYRYLRICSVAEEILPNVQFVDHASVSWPNMFGGSGATNLATALGAIARQPTVPLIYSMNRSPYWMDADIPTAMGHVRTGWGEDSWAILYPGYKHWVDAARNISELLLEEAGASNP